MFKWLIVFTIILCFVTGFSVSGCKEAAAETTAAETTAADKTSGEDEYDLSLYSITTTNPNFDKWLSDAESATGLKIEVLAATTDSDLRQAKVTTILSSGDSSIDILEINDEMASSTKNTGWLEPLQDTVLTEDIISNFPLGYIADLLTSEDGDIIGVPGYSGYLCFWVDQAKLDKYGFESIDTKEDFIAFGKAATADGNFGYGGSWEKTYSHNEMGVFVNLFGGDYLDWTNPASKEAIQFMYDMVNTWEISPIDQIADKYEQMNQKFIDGKYAMIFQWEYWGASVFNDAGRYGEDQIHIAPMPQFAKKSVFTDSWSYVLNAASENKEAAIKFLQYVAGEEGMVSAWNNFNYYPARADVAKSLPDNEFKAINELYETYEVRGRPMLPQTMEYITDMGTNLQLLVQDKITVDEFCEQAKQYVEKYK